jgi:3'-phosphoadenosine 5'-phosphosulfate sulfotransferase (PAPS reductase)/FAD synthetase
MKMTENEFLLQDRITKIKSINEQYDLLNNAYISFSGGKDSTVLSVLIDEALPGNKIPRVYVDTKLDYKMLREFALDKVKSDDRFVVVTHNKNIKQSLEQDGYPFKSKLHSRNVMYRQNGLDSDYLKCYFRKDNGAYGKSIRQCPKQLEYQYDFNDFKISDKCCINMKEEPLKRWQKENSKSIYIGNKGC